MKTLQEIGLKHGTDKSRNQHKGVTYLQLYEKYLKDKKELPLNILELGVLSGNSVKTWRDYLVNSQIVGLDIDPKTKRFTSDRIEIFIGSQDSIELRDEIETKYQKFDMILDDASHVNQLTFKSFDLYWPLLRTNGIYVIEDLPGCWSDMNSTIWSHPGMKYNNKNINVDNSTNNFNDFIIEKVYNLQVKENVDMYSVEFYRGSMIMRKHD